MADLSTDAGWRAFEQLHGGYLGTPEMLPPDPQDTSADRQHPYYQYTFGDGTQIAINDLGQVLSSKIDNTPKAQPGETRKVPHAQADGSTVLLTERSDGKGNWSVDASAPPEPLLPPKASLTPPHTITVTGKGTMQQGADGSWGLIPGSEPAAAPKEPDKPTTQITEVGGNRVQVITNPDGTTTQTILGPATRAGENASDLSAQGARQQSALSAQTSQQAIAAYNAKIAADQKAWQDRVDQGYEIKPADLESMRTQNAQTLAILEAQLKDASAQATFARDQPYKDAEQQRLAAAQTETGRHNQAGEDQARLQTAAGTLGEQAKGARDTIDAGVKLGVAPPSSLVRMAFDPYQTVMDMLARNGVQPGQSSQQAPVSMSAPAPQPAPAAPYAAPTPQAAPQPAMAAPLPTQTPDNRDQWWNDQAGTQAMASGGVIREPVVGQGMMSGRQYLFGEAGPETVVPGPPARDQWAQEDAGRRAWLQRAAEQDATILPGNVAQGYGPFRPAYDMRTDPSMNQLGSRAPFDPGIAAPTPTSPYRTRTD